LQIYDFFLIYELSHNYFLILQTKTGMQKRFFLLFSVFFLMGLPLEGQEIRSGRQAVARGDSLYRAYQFQQALSVYQSADVDDDPLLVQYVNKKIACTQEALRMSAECANPRVVDRRTLPREDFFLYYPLPEGAWHPSPNPLDPQSGYPVYLPEGSDVVYFSALDESGSRSLFLSEDLDSLWRAPRHPAEALLSSGSEIYPMLSANRQILYFASDGMGGLGGYDLFYSTWDATNAIWSEPKNLGLPYNSPDDDFLMMDTADGKYLLFASDRDCARDSVHVYVLEYDSSPSRMEVRNPEELKQLAALAPSETGLATRVSGSADTRLYMRWMTEVRTLRDSLYKHEKDLDAYRKRLSEAAQADVAAISSLIRDRENALLPLRRRINEAYAEIRKIESSFLRRGTTADQPADQAGEEEKGVPFKKQEMGPALEMGLSAYDTDYYFNITTRGGFAPDGELPDGVVYQIFFCTSASRLQVEDLGGLSPVYERLNANLRYSYFAGLFFTYKDALRQLNRVRQAGFPEARISAYSDGRAIPVNQARQEE